MGIFDKAKHFLDNLSNEPFARKISQTPTERELPIVRKGNKIDTEYFRADRRIGLVDEITFADTARTNLKNVQNAIKSFSLKLGTTKSPTEAVGKKVHRVTVTYVGKNPTDITYRSTYIDEQRLQYYRNRPQDIRELFSGGKYTESLAGYTATRLRVNASYRVQEF